VYVFGRGLTERQAGFYYEGMRKRTLLGPVTAGEEAARAARVAAAEKRKAELAALGLEEGGGGMERMMMSGPVADCVTNAPLFITNTVCFYDTNAGWTVQFEVQGTNGPADIFSIGALGTTNVWTVLERGPSCARYEYVNQSSGGRFYILGTMLDTDGDGLTDAYEKLLSKSNSALWDTDGDEISDRDEVVLGTNPLVNEIALASGRMNFQYNGAGWLTNVFGGWNKGIILDFEGNVKNISQ
jgi:hypothetical protein